MRVNRRKLSSRLRECEETSLWDHKAGWKRRGGSYTRKALYFAMTGCPKKSAVHLPASTTVPLPLSFLNEKRICVYFRNCLQKIYGTKEIPTVFVNIQFSLRIFIFCGDNSEFKNQNENKRTFGCLLNLSRLRFTVSRITNVNCCSAMRLPIAGSYHAGLVFDVPQQPKIFSRQGTVPLLRLLVLLLTAVLSSSTSGSTTREEDEITSCTRLRRQQKLSVVHDANVHGSQMNTSHRKVYFQHIHKAGGTTMCAMAELAHEIIGIKNCNCDPALGPVNGLAEFSRLLKEKHALKAAGLPTRPLPAPGFRETQDLLRGSLEQQCRFFAGTSLTFIANEAPSPNTVLIEAGLFRYIMLRHPYDRHVSEFNHCLRKQCIGNFERSDFTRWLEGKKGTHSNFQTKVILGDESYNRPLGDSDLTLAKERLQSAYSLVLILEKFEPRGRLLL